MVPAPNPNKELLLRNVLLSEPGAAPQRRDAARFAALHLTPERACPYVDQA